MDKPTQRAVSFGGLAFLAAIYVFVWLTLPSNTPHGDAFDELILIEAPQIQTIAKHPVAEPSVWLLMSALRMYGYEGSAIRPAQLWNAFWLTLALVGAGVFALRSTNTVLWAYAVVLLLSGLYASLHLALDPFMVYWPPSLALMTWSFILCARPAPAPGPPGGRPPGRWIRWTLAVALLTVTPLYNPMCLAGAPVVVALWLRGAGSGTRLRKGTQAILLLVAPLVGACGIGLWLAPDTGLAGRAAFGTWASTTLRDGWLGFTSALVPRAEGLTLLGPLRGDYSIAAFAVSVCGLLCVVAAFLTAACALASLSAARRFSVWLLVSAASAAVILWWDPAQGQFWLLPVWLLVMGASDAAGAMNKSTATYRRQIRGVAGAALCIQGLAFWVANGAGYVLPSATRPNTRADFAKMVATQFRKSDLIVFRVYQEPAIDYYAGVNTRGMLALAAAPKQEGKSTFDLLGEMMIHVQGEGGRVFLEAPPEGEEWTPEIVTQRANVDYTTLDFARILWGRRIEVGGRTFVEAVGMR